MIKLINELIDYYKKFDSNIIPTSHPKCPLCLEYNNPEKGYFGSSECSKECPWFVFEGYGCFIIYKNQTTRERLDRLYRWKKLVEEGNN